MRVVWEVRMNPGKLRHRVTFVGEVRTEDEGGGGVITLEDGPEVWANVVPLSLRERTEAAAQQVTATHRVEMRFREDVAPYSSLRHAGRLLEIRGMVDVDERRTELHFVCEERR